MKPTSAPRGTDVGFAVDHLGHHVADLLQLLAQVRVHALQQLLLGAACGGAGCIDTVIDTVIDPVLSRHPWAPPRQ